MPYHGYGMGPMMWLLGALVLVSLVLLVFMVFRWPGHPELHHKTPEEILRERYARGEIDDEEFERRRERLYSRKP